MPDDATLLRTYLDENSETAFTELVQRHLGLVYSVALRRVGGDAHLAEDVAQRVFCDLARKAPQLRQHPSLAGWLYASAHHASAAFVRAEQRRKVREHNAHLMADLSPKSGSEDPDQAGAQLRPLLDDVIVRLDTKEREAVVLRFFSKHSFAEIGAALQISEEAARKRVDRALEKLRVYLARRGVSSSFAALGVALMALHANSVPTALPAAISGAAIAQAGATGAAAPSALALAKALLPAAAVVTLGAFLINGERSAQRGLREELARLARPEEILALQSEHRRLAYQLGKMEQQRQLRTSLPDLRRAAEKRLAQTPPIQATLHLSAQGILKWNNDAVTLREFVERLQALQTGQPEGGSRLLIRASPGAPLAAMRYAIDEIRKAGIAEIALKTDDPTATLAGDRWF